MIFNLAGFELVMQELGTSTAANKDHGLAFMDLLIIKIWSFPPPINFCYPVVVKEKKKQVDGSVILVLNSGL